MGEIRRTWYGDRVWDVKSVAGSKNIAYTNLDLGLHMDLVHFETPPRFQLLHYLHSHPVRAATVVLTRQQLRGGESYFVDSFEVAERIRSSSPAAFAVLVREPVAFEYRNGGHWRHWERPTIELDRDGRVKTGAWLSEWHR